MSAQHSAAIERLVRVYEGAMTVSSGSKTTTINELTDQIPAVRPETLLAAVDALNAMGPVEGNKLLSEEDKGAVLMGLYAVSVRKPLAMARWYSYDLNIPQSVVVPVSMEYAVGKLRVNGITRGDRLTLVDDTLSTGGTAVSLIRAARELGAKVVEMRVVVEKLGFGGRQKLMDEAGLFVRAAIGISIDPTGLVTVDEVLQRPVTRQDKLKASARILAGRRSDG